VDARSVRESVEAKWRAQLARHGGMFSSGRLSGDSPPSVFVGSQGYPRVLAGPMSPPEHGDTSLMDSPEGWAGLGLDQIVSRRLRLVRGVRRVGAGEPGGRYVEGLQELAMSSRPVETQMEFDRSPAPPSDPGPEAPPFGPVGVLSRASYSGAPAERSIEKAYGDRDAGAREAVWQMYGAGVPVSSIQKCFSVGMVGRRRRLVPTRWSITAVDDALSRMLVQRALDMPLIDGCRVFSHSHLGNTFAVALFPHRWIYEMVEAWHAGGGLGFGADREGPSGIGHPPAIAGAYFAARLAVAEYLAEKGAQAGAWVLRSIRPEYCVPVGVWQVREGVRAAMAKPPAEAPDPASAFRMAAAATGVSERAWHEHSRMRGMLRQQQITRY